MRLTIRINESNQAAQQNFAVLWLDTEQRLWSREAHQGIDLPTWGQVKNVEGAVALCSADSGEALCRLDGLALEKAGAPAAAMEHGTAVLGPHICNGDWRVQAIDLCSLPPEHQEFTVVR